MSYMKEPLYVWKSDSLHEDVCPISCDETSHLLLHIWFRNNADEIWNAFPLDNESDESLLPDFMGFTLRMDYFDQLVVMRYAELQEQDRTPNVSASALQQHGENYGSRSLQLLSG